MNGWVEEEGERERKKEREREREREREMMREMMVIWGGRGLDRVTGREK